MVDDPSVSGCHGNRGRHLADKLFARLVNADHREIGIMFDGAGCHAESLGHVSDFPWFSGAARTGVAQEKCAGMDEFRGIGFPRARDSLQHLALFLRQCDSVSRSHAL